jgi:protein CpxP
MSRFRSITITAVVAGMLAAGAAAAQGPGGGRGGRGAAGPGGPGVPGGPGFGGRGGPGGGLPFRELNLSEAQQQQVRDITREHRDRNQQAADALRTAMDAQRKAVQTLPINEGLIRSTTQALVEAQTDMAIEQARMQSEIFTLLTPAQQDQVKKLQAEREARAGQRPARGDRPKPAQ